ncbi:MAG: sodium:alanine symporter family protein [Lentisphaerae bacterium]|jgi:alanine or glycine:cation symporter, AGCS family|nr:sodium:alanine symporter family protein [Lentisphaerota bacterium]MBT4816475.1 sodium:alanine symporter family protein [Lentisphaerota bacterium]MBT5609283.1 sodium:alanine symporter family protein [Lentisphaerota bacterium]MBT7059423.1 sodium:alanine symporter family protein [Lentisphaerota bacterium]MBT7847807.1 sodium:alanine symporter family protein [Lentisphaerota bacterium]
MSETLLKINTAVNGFVWGPYMLIGLVGVGVYLTLRTRFIQFAKFRLMWRETMGKAFRKNEGAEGDVTPMQAMTVAMGGTVGVGNIAGVATAIAIGGPGAIFWMLVSGLVGMATKFAEVVLGCHYRKREEGQPMMGGPMMYIERGLGGRWKWLAVMFCVFGALAAFGIGNMVQANSVADGMKCFGVPPWVTGLILIVSVGLVTIGGIKRIAQVAMFCVPFMCILYMLGAFAIIVINLAQLPAVIALVFKSAFTPTAATGGFAGVGIMMAMRYGIARGVFSNEAGLGSAPIAHATATTDHPVRQGLWGVFEVFFDTIVMCTATALVIMLTGVWNNGESGAVLTISGFNAVFGGKVGTGLVTFCMILTAYDTLLAWCFYGETCTAYLLGHGKVVRTVYRIIWLPFTMLGAMGSLKVVWDVADTLNGLMAIPNLIALVALGGVVVKLMKEFFAGESYTEEAEANGGRETS